MDLTRLFLSAVPAVVITLVLQSIFGFSRPAGVKLVEKAKRAGRVAEGVLVKKTYLQPIADQLAYHREGRWALTYEYQVGGRSYRYHVKIEGEPAETLPLYYPAGKPGRAISELEAPSRAGCAHWLVILLPVLLWAIFYQLLAHVF